jgi:hypothetical protein
MRAVIFAKEFWLYSQLSVAKYAGGIDISEPGDGKHHFLIVDEKGQPFSGNVYQKNTPADLVDENFIPLYKKLGRVLFLAIIQANPQASRKELKEILTEAAEVKKKGEEAEKAAKEAKLKAQNPSLFD